MYSPLGVGGSETKARSCIQRSDLWVIDSFKTAQKPAMPILSPSHFYSFLPFF